MVMGPSFGKRILKVPLASGRGAGASPGASSMNWQPTRINALWRYLGSLKIGLRNKLLGDYQGQIFPGENSSSVWATQIQ